MTTSLRKLEVRLERAREDSELVGQLVEHRGRVGFEYAPAFIARVDRSRR